MGTIYKMFELLKQKRVLLLLFVFCLCLVLLPKRDYKTLYMHLEF